MANTNREHTHQGPNKAPTTPSEKTITAIGENREKELGEVGTRRRDVGKVAGEADRHAIATRIYATSERES